MNRVRVPRKDDNDQLGLRAEDVRLGRRDLGSACIIAGGYLLISLIYIAFSDRLVEEFVASAYQNQVQTLKGGIFVSLSALVLGFSIRYALAKARASEMHYRMVFEQSPIGIIMAAPDNRIFTANPAACTMLQRGHDELVMLGLDCLVGPQDAEVLSRLTSPPTEKAGHSVEGAAALERQSEEIDLLRGDGASFVAEISSGRFTLATGAARVCLILRDISSLKSLQEQLRHGERMQAVGQLAGGIAHDFNNLLTAIVGNAEVLRDGLAKGDQLRPRAEAVIHAGERASLLTRRLLAFSRRQILEPRAIQVNELVWTMELLVDRMLRDRVRVDYHLAEALPVAYVDPAQLETALLNLVVNARDASEPGGLIQVSTALAQLTRENGQPLRAAVLSVRDYGSGMSAEVLRHATEPFFTTKGVGAGSGLGLSMVYGFLQQSGGELRLESAPGAGTTVSLYLPLAEEMELGEREEGTEGAAAEAQLSEALAAAPNDAAASRPRTTARWTPAS